MPVNPIPGKLRYTNQGGVVFGDTVANNIVLEEGWLAVNTDTDTVNIHDGITTGGRIAGGLTPDVSTGSLVTSGPIVAPYSGKAQFARSSKGNWGRYRVSGNFKEFSAAATNETYVMVVSAEGPFDSISIELPPVVNGSAISAANLIVKAVASVDEAMAYASLSSWTYLSVPAQPGLATSSLLVGSGFTSVESNILRVKSVPRSDGVNKPLLAILIQYPSGSPRTLIKYTLGGSDMTAWRTGAKDGRILACNYVGGYSAPSGATTTVANFPIFGVNFLYRKPVVNISRVGDSKSDGAGALTWTRDGILVDQISKLNVAYPGISYGDMNFSRPNAPGNEFYPQMLSYLNAGVRLPDIIILPLWSVNSFASDVSSASAILAGSTLTARHDLINKAKSLGIKVIVYNWTPRSTASADLTLTDYLRVQTNSEYSDIVDLDFSALISGVNIGGQVQPISGSMPDGTHEGSAYLLLEGNLLYPYLIPSL